MKLHIGTKTTPFLSEKMFGLFFEDINYAADGGLYAEMIENRQFAFRKATTVTWGEYRADYAGEYGWSVCEETQATMEFVEGDALNEQNPHYMVFDVRGEQAAFVNKAYDGICMKSGEEYRLTMWLRAKDYSDAVTVQVLGADGTIIADAEIDLKGQPVAEIANGWQQFTLTMRATADVKNGNFVVRQKRGTLAYAYISLMPVKAVCGVFREDLFHLLIEMRPGFLRFPGGCIVEGANLNNRYRWKNTVGLPWERRWNWSRWAVHDVTMGQGEPLFYPYYNQSYGVGFYEYFLLSECLGAKPLPVLSVGLACQFQSNELVPTESEEFQAYLQDALDLIEFANGTTDTHWGAIRAQMGHPEPFHLEYIGIGNEQWETERVDFFARYKAFEEAIHKVYPEIGLIGSAGPDVGTERYQKAWDFYRAECKANAHFTEAVDEHYYMSPEWFYEHVHMYDEVSREIPVFAGEYAAHTAQKKNNWEAALAEAAFMCGLERNGDVIRFASAAPLFAREGYAQWKPDYIWFDGTESMGTPGYYVQKMFGVYTGTKAVEYQTEDAPEGLHLAVSQNDKCTYIKLINAGEQAISLSELSIAETGVNLAGSKILQMHSKDLQAENHLGDAGNLMLREATADGAELTLPAYSCTVIIAED